MNRTIQVQGSNRPIEMISWCEAIVFCNQLSVQEGNLYTLNPNHCGLQWNKTANGYRLLAHRGGES